MILAEQGHHQPPSDESNNKIEEVCLSNNVASWQSTNNNSDNKIEDTAVVHRQPDDQKIVQVDDDEDDDEDEEDSFTYPSSEDDDEGENKKDWVAKRLPEIPQPSVNNQVTGSSKVNISNTNKNVYEGNVVIHQTFYNSLANRSGNNSPECIDAVPTAKITIDKDTEAAVGPKLSNVSSHPLYPFNDDKVTSWFTKRRIIAITGAVLAGIVIISLTVYFTTSGTKKPAYVPSPPNDTSITNGESYILGVPYVERRQWVAQPPTEPGVKVAVYPPPYVIISHTATEPCFTRGECIYNVRYIQNFHIESKGWDDIAYNFLVGGDGAIYEGRGWDIEGAHTFNYNKKSIGISFIGTFTKKEPTEQQIYAASKLIEYALQSGKLDPEYKLLGHRQCIKTESPGEMLYNIIKTWPHWSPTP